MPLLANLIDLIRPIDLLSCLLRQCPAPSLHAGQALVLNMLQSIALSSLICVTEVACMVSSALGNFHCIDPQL